MLIIGGLIHDFIDGMAIGISFASRSKSTAISTFIAILSHEVPSRVAEIAILLHSNFSIAKAVMINCIENCASIIGAIVGLSLGSINEVINKYLLAIVIGNFLYIGLIDMMPYMKNTHEGKLWFFQLTSFAFGIGTMYLVTLAE